MAQRHSDRFETELIQRVPWRDLVAMRPIDGLIECIHPLPWLAASLILASLGFWLIAPIASFLFFLTALRLNHEAIHGHLGFGRHHPLVLHGLSAVMLGSNSAVAFNHLRHHTAIGTPDDVEGKCGRMTLWQVLIYGPAFPIEMHRHAWREGGWRVRRRMLIDAVLNAATVALVIASGWAPLLYHVAAMIMAQCLTALFAVWITHHDLDGTAPIARTQRSPLINRLSYNMFLHLEHHLFPAVPVKRLAILGQRIDAAAPRVRRGMRMVIAFPRTRI